MGNIQAEQLIERVFCHEKRETFYAIDEAISILYINGYIPPSQMKKSRNKLIAEIQKESEGA